jgi:hypothetical protein
MAALSTWWTVGWVVGAVVVALVAILVITITLLAHRTDAVAQDLVTDLASIAQKTDPLRNVAATNDAVRTITRCLRLARGGGVAHDRYSTSPGWRP